MRGDGDGRQHSWCRYVALVEPSMTFCSWTKDGTDWSEARPPKTIGPKPMALPPARPVSCRSYTPGPLEAWMGCSADKTHCLSVSGVVRRNAPTPLPMAVIRTCGPAMMTWLPPAIVIAATAEWLMPMPPSSAVSTKSDTSVPTSRFDSWKAPLQIRAMDSPRSNELGSAERFDATQNASKLVSPEKLISRASRKDWPTCTKSSRVSTTPRTWMLGS